MPRLLPLGNLAQHPGLAGGIAEMYRSAACVCLDRHHQPRVNFDVRDDGDHESIDVDWTPATPEIHRSFANEIDTTEAGGYAVIIAAVELRRGWLAVRRAEAGTGADYYVGPPGSGVEDLEDCVRLEVSATARGRHSHLERLLTRKIAQARSGRSNLPSMAGVVGFEEQVILIGPIEA